MNTCIFSEVERCFHCATWPSLSTRTFTIFNEAIMDTYRTITHNNFHHEDNPTPITDAQVIQNYALLKPTVLICTARIQLFARIFKKNVIALITIIHSFQHCTYGWIPALKNDLKWLATCPHYSDYANYTLVEWIGVISVDPKLFISNVRKFSATPFANLFHQSTLPSLPTSPPTPSPLEARLELFKCGTCSRNFESLQLLTLHDFHVHGNKHIINQIVSTTFCEICLVQLHTRERLLNHVKGHKGRPNICRRNYLDMQPIYTKEELKIIDAELAPSYKRMHAIAVRRHKAEIPCFSLQGPFLPVKYVACPSQHHPLGRGYKYYN